MKLCPPALAAAFAVIQAGLYPHGALAAAHRCPGMTVEADARFRSRWSGLLERIEREFSVRADLDACALVDLRVEGEAIILVSVTLPDGRAVSRRLTGGDDLVPTLQALLLLPAPSPPAPAEASPPAPAAPQSTAWVAETLQRDAAPPTTASRSPGLELSLFAAARARNGQIGLGLGALSLLEHDDWLFGFEGRADSYRAVSGDGRKTALELALLAGRRCELDSVTLDLSAGLAAAMLRLDESHSRSQGVSVSRTGTITESSSSVPAAAPRSGPVPRLLLGARLDFNPRSVFGTFVGIEGELGPALASAERSSAHLPGYSVGVSLGARLGTP